MVEVREVFDYEKVMEVAASLEELGVEGSVIEGIRKWARDTQEFLSRAAVGFAGSSSSPEDIAASLCVLDWLLEED